MTDEEQPEEQGSLPQPLLLAIYAALVVALVLVLVLVGTIGT